MLLDPFLKEKFQTLVNHLGYKPPTQVSQNRFEDILEEFRRRLIVEMEFKMIGELGTKLNNKLKENREKERKERTKQKKAKASIPNGASPRELIAATSSLPSAGTLIR
jgi:hypothetical protein